MLGDISEQLIKDLEPEEITLDLSLETMNAPCWTCKHYFRANHVGNLYRCKAFKKIPDNILSGKNNHRKPVEGDHGIQYEKKE